MAPLKAPDEAPYCDYSLWVDQEAIDVAARKLAEYGYDIGDRPVVEGVGVSPNLRMAVAVAMREAAQSFRS